MEWKGLDTCKNMTSFETGRKGRNPHIWGYLNKCWVSVHLPVEPTPSSPQSNSLSHPTYPTYGEIRTVTRSFLIISIFRTEILLIRLFEALFSTSPKNAGRWPSLVLPWATKHSLKPLAIYFGLFSNDQ